MPVLTWYPPEVLLPLLLPLGILLLLWGRQRSIWWRNLGLALILFIIANFIFIVDLPARMATAYTQAVAETSATPLFAELRTPVLRGPPADLWMAAQQLPGYEVVAQDSTGHTLDLRVPVPGAWWPGPPLRYSQLHVQFTQVRAGSQIDVRASWPDQGRDFGCNRRLIGQFVTRLRDIWTE